MATPQWAPGTIYSPGALVVPRSANIVVQEQPHNASFDDGLTHWTQSSEFGSGTIASASDNVFDGTESAYFAGANGTGPKNSVFVTLTNDFEADVTPGKVINFSCYISRNPAPVSTSFCNGGARIYWLNGSHEVLSYSVANNPPPFNGDTPAGMVGGLSSGGWTLSSGAGTAPPDAVYAVAAITLTGNTSGAKIWADKYTWDYTHQGLPDGLVFRAVQADTGTSASSEPVWPVNEGDTVADGSVTWQAEFASRITWQATSILHSGDTEPTWPEEIGAAVPDNGTIAWVAYDGRVTDAKCPQSQIVTAGASKIFAGDQDIIAFSATTNPLDWSTENDAGFLPFGLQAFGNEAVKALGLYRSNLLAFNGAGYQMWQIDEDPANMALLDASPVGCTYPKSIQPVSNDAVFLTTLGIRSIGIAGASTNLQAGSFGKQIDPLVQAAILAGYTPRALFFPGAGQYMLWFSNQAFVLTMNGGAQDMSWSRYILPDEITDWTLMDGQLYLRTLGGLVWRFDPTATQDDYYCDPNPPVLDGTITGSDNTTADLTWTPGAPVDTSPVEGYRLYNAATGDLIVDTPSLGYDQTGLDTDTEYSYYVTAYSAQAESAPSNTVVLDTGHPGTVVDIFTSSGTWTKRPGFISAVVYALGGGGGGAGGCSIGGSGFLGSGAGGGGGGFAKLTLAAADLSATHAVTVGASGTGGAGGTTITGIGGSGALNSSAGTDGGDSTFATFVTAHGGKGGPMIQGSPGAGGAGATSGGTSPTTETGGAGGTGQASHVGNTTPKPGSGTTNAGPGGGGGGWLNGDVDILLAGNGGVASGTPSVAGVGGTTKASITVSRTGIAGTDGGAGNVGSLTPAGGGGGGGGGANCNHCPSTARIDAVGAVGGKGGSYGAGGGAGGQGQSNAASGLSLGSTATGGVGGDGGAGIVIVVNTLT